MKTSNKLLLVFALAAFLSSASLMMYAKSQMISKDEYREQIKLSGNTIERVLHENLTTDDIEMGDNFNWTLDPNSTQVIVTGDESIVKKLTISDKGQFQIRTGENGYYSNDYEKVFVSVGIMNLSKIRIDGNGNARISATEPLNLTELDVQLNGNSKCTLEITTGDIKINANGNARLTLKGSSDNINAHASGNGRIYAEEITTNEVKANASGNAGFYGGVVENISGSASGNAKIEVKDTKGTSNVSTSGNARFTINR